MLEFPQAAVRSEGQPIGRAMSGAPGFRRRQVRSRERIGSYDWSSFRGFGISRRINHGHAGRTRFSGHGIAGSRLAIQRQAQDLAEWLVRILGRRHALPLANCKKQITAIRRKSDLAAELSALASLSIAPDHLEILKARRIRADLQPGPCERQARAA